MWFSFNPITFSTSLFPSFYIWLERIASGMNLHNHSQLIDPSKMSSSDVVAQSAFDVLRLGRSSHFIVARLLRFRTPKTSRSIVNSWESLSLSVQITWFWLFICFLITVASSFTLAWSLNLQVCSFFFWIFSKVSVFKSKPQSASMFLFLLNLFESFCL